MEDSSAWLGFQIQVFGDRLNFQPLVFHQNSFFQTIHHIEDIEELEHKLKQFLLRFCIEA